MPSTAGIIRAAAEPKPNPVSTEALWLWGRLRDFERDGLLDAEPATILETMTPQILDASVPVRSALNSARSRSRWALCSASAS